MMKYLFSLNLFRKLFDCQFMKSNLLRFVSFENLCCCLKDWRVLIISYSIQIHLLDFQQFTVNYWGYSQVLTDFLINLVPFTVLFLSYLCKFNLITLKIILSKENCLFFQNLRKEGFWACQVFLWQPSIPIRFIFYFSKVV